MEKWNFGPKKRQKTAKIGSEFEIQADIIVWARLTHILVPELRFLTASLNGVQISVGQRVKALKSGLNKGTPDLSLPCARRGYHGLYIEVKTQDGVLSKEQKEWRDFLKRENYFWYLCRSTDSAKRLLTWYLSGHKGS